ncbi:MAG: thioredoxin domain-containing protein, partial [Anaerolineales bacterium]|nr:thioredoxin domain-containing protein [Anaerolineales bacterium]
DAPITIVEYTDYQCPYCNRHVSETLPGILTNLVETGRVFYVLKDFPLTQIHPNAAAASVAARCADEQNAYWEMHDALFAEQGEWGSLGTNLTAYFADLSDHLGLDGEAMTACINSGKYDDVVQTSLEEGLSLGVTGTPTFFVDGFPLVGARPIEHFELAVSYAEEGTLADAYVQSAPEPTAVPSGPVDVPEGDAFVIGDPDAPVTIVEYTDFQCPYCGRHFAQTFPQIKENFIDTGVVRYVFKDFPLSFHPQADIAAEAARCAGDQNAYLAMHDLLFDTQDEWSGDNSAAELFIGYAGDLGLDSAAFSDCLQNHTYADAVQADLLEGSRFGVNGTPAFFLNGYFLSGAQPYDLFEEAIVSLATEDQ